MLVAYYIIDWVSVYLVRSGTHITAAWYSIITIIIIINTIITSAVASTFVTINVVLGSKEYGQSDNQGNDYHDVVNNSGNVAADGNSMEGPGSVPLFSRPRVTQSISLK